MAIADIPGVRVTDLTVHADDRGSFLETYRQAWLPADARPVVQSNLSRSRPGVLRGLHFHRHQADYWCVLEGTAFVALADLRPGSPTFRTARTDTFDTDVGLRGLYVPPGVAHGFCTLSAVVLLYQVDGYFTGEDEFGLAWDDAELAIPWPVTDPVLSDRDRANPSLTAVLGNPSP